MAVTGPRVRVSIQDANYLRASDDLFSSPLSRDLVARLDCKKCFVVTEEDGHPIGRFPTLGLTQVISYLQWTKSSTARGLNDGRHWPGLNESLSAPDREIGKALVPPGFNQSQLIPSDKPQSEFAIRSQGGKSFFSDTGRAGY